MDSGMMFRCCLAVSVVIICSASTATKREDSSISSGGSSVGGGGGGASPVYSSPNNLGSVPVYSNTGYESAESSPASTYKASPGSSGLYYYYYPVQPKPQDQATSGSSTQNYIASPVASSNFEEGDSSQVSYPDQTAASYGVGDSSYGGLSQISAAYNSPYLSAAAYQGGYGSIPGYGTAASSVGAAYSPGTSSYPSYVPAAAGSSAFQYPNIAGYPSASAQYPAFAVPQGNYPGNTRRYGLGSLIMPMLALAGLGLLIPTVTGLGTTRNKRSVDATNTGGQNTSLKKFIGYVHRLESAYSLYKKAVEEEECVNRIICELGNAMSDLRGKSAIMVVMQNLFPRWMQNKVDIFKSGILAADTGKCKAYKC